MRIALISDVHLEYNTMSDFEFPKATMLVCAGDIGNPYAYSYVQFLEKVKKIYDYVLLVPGNHEYHQPSQGQTLTSPKTMKDVHKHLQKICKNTGCIFLQKKSVEINNVYFLGCTLWADPFSSGGEKVWTERHDTHHISDFKKCEDYMNLHKNHKKWLEKEIENVPANKKIIVISHHLPSYALVDDAFKNSTSNGYYVSHSDSLVQSVDIWIGGHTHKNINTILHGTRCYCNPVGYPWEHSHYNKDFYISIS